MNVINYHVYIDIKLNIFKQTKLHCNKIQLTYN